LLLQVTRHGLEYPQFFARLYQLLVPEVRAATTFVGVAAWQCDGVGCASR
jgi:hypothetical protein